jgi:3-methyl-2-oxobutanoate hydroxymethyltransferase
MLGMFDKFVPTFVKRYANIGDQIVEGLEKYRDEIKSGAFPAKEHAFGGITREDLDGLIL